MIVEQAPAKINLALHVRARRADGYHEIETLFAFLRDGDMVTIEPSVKDGFQLSGPYAPDLVEQADNLVTQAAERFRDIFDLYQPVLITLDKHLPVASGIGGGSADAAATLRGLARLNGIPADDRRLFDCAEALGSDVPACLAGKTAMGRGRGEQLDYTDGLAGTPVLLVNPSAAVSTAAVFRAWDGVDRGSIAEGALLDRALTGRNDLEAPARMIAPVIDNVLNALRAHRDPILVRMSGSGATCFALYSSEQDRHAAARAIRADKPAWWCLESALA
ncbi:4-(cytidine 5'-diphospho)-2-C-methyl-D-erythritol kinase [Sphingomonas sp. So64.6b]|uniref:4-(cytidine 5'-diphospho)-2-C-methyl-D-erythritol kinase n=1 Tax=Sphingomonas sp. So64.6b TaxID=2997354 RepID=UPI0016000E26|nr:4-(cytidine 5'-diphospho)-2-C-methyl-D-erythritol kinase [Sphingomonas sp. So64.6b]QNA83855.1 4-(cytidine 5'-diphospho)-2-C-methyl-D-erythritol kinase [Sphingomonas sp. So64.6b]